MRTRAIGSNVIPVILVLRYTISLGDTRWRGETGIFVRLARSISGFDSIQHPSVSARRNRARNLGRSGAGAFRRAAFDGSTVKDRHAPLSRCGAWPIAADSSMNSLTRSSLPLSLAWIARSRTRSTSQLRLSGAVPRVFPGWLLGRCFDHDLSIDHRDIDGLDSIGRERPRSPRRVVGVT